MSFPDAVRQEALVAAARHCCVCHRYKGIGVEVHHIVPRSSGGADTVDNAIALCFDCHAAAGHYNPRHPRGTKFSPEELRKHRDAWHRIVASGKVPVAADENFGVHIRHLLSLDNGATLELLNLERTNIPFPVTYVQNNEVLQFMRRTLNDDLPFTWQTSERLAGHYWGRHYSSLADLHAANKTFEGNLKRALCEPDFGPDGIRSGILRGCYKEGMPLSDIGIAEVAEGGCGDGAMIYFSLRRPLYVFCDISNLSRVAITITAIRARLYIPRGLDPRRFTADISETITVPITPVLLRPNENLIMPTSVLLGPFEVDDLRTDYSVDESISQEQGQSFGLRMNASETGTNHATDQSDYFRIGPSIDIQGLELTTPTGNAVVHVHRFHPNQCYLWHRAWHVGSCPHVYFQDVHGTWSHFGEVFREGWRNAVTERIVVPQSARLMRVAEVDFETSILNSVVLDGVEQLDEPRRLTRGDHMEFIVRPGSCAELRGLYDCAIEKPQCAAHIRQKRSLLISYAMSL